MSPTTVHLVGLGCARNDVDTEELAARFAAAGFTLTEEPADAEVVVVNTCGFIEAAKRDSIDQLLAAADLRGPGRTRQVVATGCLAERYGRDLAASLPEVDAVIGFDGYADIAATVRGLLAGRPAPSHTPGDRRRRSPLAPVARPAAVQLALPGHGTTAVDAASRARSAAAPGRGPASGPPILRRRLSSSPSAPLKIASGCDRRCAFCAIPSFRGAFVSRPPADILAEAAWLGEQGVRELCLVSENTTSYGKDLGGSEPLSRLLRQLGALAAGWVRLSYLQPAELTDALISAIAGTDRVVPYFDVPFQHAARPVLRRMRRFGDAESYLGLIDRIRAAAPGAAIRSNVIVGFPGETPDDLAVLTDFLADADLDAVGVFGYSDEEDTAAAGLDGHLDEAEIAARVEAVADLADILMAERAGRRVGTAATVLVEA
ncbi:MAG: radical SAM protein, partial [Propionibacteriaceae bacterium]|nr:radical SAM protein [Propionibacteriaceae bacterium]